MNNYATSQNRRLDEATIAAATTWTEPDRDVAIARGRALRLIGAASRDAPIRCVWSDRPLDADSLDVDHCFPWSAWPCGDLWNLVPAHREVNQRKKRDRLPSDDLLIGRRKHIVSWWRDAYETEGLHPQFLSEARVSLPALAGAGGLGSDSVFAAMRFQRLRLQRDQQIPEWKGN
jgi:HNH endonuclease